MRLISRMRRFIGRLAWHYTPCIGQRSNWIQKVFWTRNFVAKNNETPSRCRQQNRALLRFFETPWGTKRQSLERKVISIIFITKKISHSEPSNHRPLSLSPGCCKMAKQYLSGHDVQALFKWKPAQRNVLRLGSRNTHTTSDGCQSDGQMATGDGLG